MAIDQYLYQDEYLHKFLILILNTVVLFTGWQTRWFILENGVLSYYMSQEEVNQGCKGSMKVSALEIIGKSMTR